MVRTSGRRPRNLPTRPGRGRLRNRAAVPDATPFIIPAGLPPEALTARIPQGGGRRCTKERCNSSLMMPPEKSWLRWILQRERRVRSKVPRPMSIGVRTRFMVPSKVAGREDCDAGRDGHKTALEPAYLGIEGRGTLDADGCEGDGGAGWRMHWIPGGWIPLSVRVCEMAGRCER